MVAFKWGVTFTHQCSYKERITQVIEGLRAGGIIPQCFFVEFCSLFIILFDKQSVPLVD